MNRKQDAGSTDVESRRSKIAAHEGEGGGGGRAQGLWPKPLRSGWEPYSAPLDPSHWESPPNTSNGYVVVRCNGGLNQQRSAICNAVVVAKLLNATLVVPRLDTNDFWADNSGFESVYNVNLFIKSLAPDVRIAKSLPEKIKPYRLKPPREAPASWYTTIAAHTLRSKGAVYLTPFAHRLAEELGDDPWGRELERLRCRVQFHALRFKRRIRKAAQLVVEKLHETGPFIAMHLRFEKDMLAFAGCFDIFEPEQAQELQAYREKNFAEKELNAPKRRQIGKCPLTPQEAGLIVRALGFPNSTRIYLAAGKLYAEKTFLPPLRAMYPFLVNRTTVASAEELGGLTGRSLQGQAVDFLVCTQADLFIPTYDGPSNFANNVIGQRIYSGFAATIRPDRKALAQMVEERKKGNVDDKGFELAIRNMVYKVPLAGPYPRKHGHIPFLANPWPECFCRDPSYKADEFSQHPDTGGFEMQCPANQNTNSSTLL